MERYQHIIIAALLALIPSACLVVYLQLNAYGWEIVISCIAASIPLYMAYNHTVSQNKRVVENLKQNKTFHHVNTANHG